MKKIEFWEKASNYSIAICGVVLIAKMYFRKYFEDSIVIILFVGVIALIIFVLSEFMKFILKRKI
ncbi:MAG TPA: hypothetical protein DDZ41_09225 [Flavobacterium sp.]|nr:hypothetical protein [Flavobacterium sp.]